MKPTKKPTNKKRESERQSRRLTPPQGPTDPSIISHFVDCELALTKCEEYKPPATTITIDYKSMALLTAEMLRTHLGVVFLHPERICIKKLRAVKA